MLVRAAADGAAGAMPRAAEGAAVLIGQADLAPLTVLRAAAGAVDVARPQRWAAGSAGADQIGALVARDRVHTPATALITADEVDAATDIMVAEVAIAERRSIIAADATADPLVGAAAVSDARRDSRVARRATAAPLRLRCDTDPSAADLPRWPTRDTVRLRQVVTAADRRIAERIGAAWVVVQTLHRRATADALPADVILRAGIAVIARCPVRTRSSPANAPVADAAGLEAAVAVTGRSVGRVLASTDGAPADAITQTGVVAFARRPVRYADRLACPAPTNAVDHTGIAEVARRTVRGLLPVAPAIAANAPRAAAIRARRIVRPIDHAADAAPADRRLAVILRTAVAAVAAIPGVIRKAGAATVAAGMAARAIAVV